MTNNPLRALLAAIATIVMVGGCSGAGPDQQVTLTVYSSGGLGDWYADEFARFTKDTGINVELFQGGSGEVVSRLNSGAVWNSLDKEPKNIAPADLIVTLPPFIQKADKAGLLQASGVDTRGMPAESVGPGGNYVPLVGTALCFIVNPTVDPPPVTWQDLLGPRFKGRLQYSTPGEAGAGTALLLLLQHLMGKQGALDYLAQMQRNTVGPEPSTAALQGKVNSGELLIANSDVQGSLTSINDDGSEFTVFFPAMPGDSRTTVSLYYLAGVTAASQQPEEARKLLAFLLGDEAQKRVRTKAFGLPAREPIAEKTDGDTAAGLLEGVTLWTPDWNAVLAELETDLAAYQKAVR